MKGNYYKLEKPEDKLILCCSRTHLDSKTINKIKILVEENLDWDYIMINSCKNSVYKLVYYQINRLCPEDVPKNFLEVFYDDFYETNVKFKFLPILELFNILKLFKLHDIPVIPHGGPILILRAYKDLKFRKIDNTTLIINEKDIPKAKEIFLSQGYEIKLKVNPRKEHSYIKTVGEYIFNNKDGVKINLKWNYLKDYFTSTHEFDLWNINKQESVNLGGINFSNPPIEEFLFILCMEAAKVQWCRLKYICDIAELIQNNQNIDWNKVLKISGKLRLKRMLLINLFLVNQFLGVKLPETLIGKIKSDSSVINVSNQIIKRLFDDEGDDLIKIRREYHENASIRFKIRENKIDGLKDYIKSLTTPSPYQVSYMSFPLSDYTIHIRRFVQYLKEKIFGAYPMIPIHIPYLPTDVEIIKKMFKFVKLGPGDVIYDLGSGDGRIVITAAKEYGVKGVGIDIDKQLISESIKNAELSGVENLVSFIESDIMKADLSDATLVTIYMLPSLNRAIRPQLEKQLKPQTRIVSMIFTMGPWKPLKTHIISHKGVVFPIYIYKT